ncbi:MAG: polymer-forming cytoskeletal protein [bacterium]
MSLLKREKNNHSSTIETIIGPSVKVEGNFVGEGDVTVEGIVTGSVKTSKNLHIGQAARIKADVEADNINISGEIRGNVICHSKLEMSSSSKIIGNVQAASLSVEAGAILHGKCKMANNKELDAPIDSQVDSDPEEQLSGSKR